MKYVFETKDPITCCNNCPFGEESEESSWTTCMHPELKVNRSKTCRPYEESNDLPHWCPLKRLVIRTMSAKMIVDRFDLIAVKSPMDFANYVSGKLARDLAVELSREPVYQSDDSAQNHVVYRREVNTCKEIPYGPNCIQPATVIQEPEKE